MKLFKMKLYAFLLLISSSYGLHSQTLIILEKSGTTIPISINNIRSIIFSSGNLNINLKVENPISKPLSTIKYLNFTPTTDINFTSTLNKSPLKLFPNPTHDFINISYCTDNTAFLDLKIITIDGKIMHTKILNSLNINQIHLDISSWQNGMYLVLLNNGFEVITEKLIKTN